MAKKEYKIELMPGMELDLNESLERGDLVDGLTREEYEESLLNTEQETESRENAEPEGKQAEVKEEHKQEEAVEVKEEPEILKKKFKIKYQGEEQEVELTEQELINWLQKAKDYDTKMANLAKDRLEVEPFKHILETDWFKEKLKEGLESGEIEQPKEASPPAEEDIFEFERKRLDPDFEQIREAMRNWAITLPVTMQVKLDSNYAVFNREYDRIATLIRAPKTNPPLNLTKKEEKKVDKIIQAKEKAKESARVETPGAASEISRDKAKQNRIRELKKAMKEGRHADQAAAEYLILTKFQ